MSQRQRSWWAGGLFPGAALLGLVLVAGCGSEPTGDDAYSQKFEKPAGVAEPAAGTGDFPTRSEEREKEREQDALDAAKKKKGRR